MTTPSRPVLNATRARSGRYGRHMLWVLLFGTLLAALGLFAAWTWKAPDLSAANTNNPRVSTAGSPAFNAPAPATKEVPAPAPSPPARTP